MSAFRLDGYSFVYPDQWAPVTSSGNDIFLRNPFNVDQNLFVDITSPSSSRWVLSQLGKALAQSMQGMQSSTAPLDRLGSTSSEPIMAFKSTVTGTTNVKA
jgi:hypothetical protein